jgi:arsenite methyltransferase
MPGHPICAALYEKLLAANEEAGLREMRADLLRSASGRTLEVGSGTGLNLEHYPEAVTELVLTEPDPHMAKRLRRKLKDGGPPVGATEVVETGAEELPFEDASFDAVMSNGVINLSLFKGRVFAEAARVLRPGGRLAIADIVSGRALKERTRRNVELWAACIAGAIPRKDYLGAIEAQGLEVKQVRKNDYRFISDRALEACGTYEVESISLLAVKT